jgi:transposase
VLLGLADWLHRQQVQPVAMEATSDYRKPVFYLLEAEGFACWPLNAEPLELPLSVENRSRAMTSVVWQLSMRSAIPGPGRVSTLEAERWCR